MKLSARPYARVSAIGVALSACVFTTLVIAEPAGASPAAPIVVRAPTHHRAALAVVPSSASASASAVAASGGAESLVAPVRVATVSVAAVPVPAAPVVAAPAAATAPVAPVRIATTTASTPANSPAAAARTAPRAASASAGLGRAIAAIPGYASGAPVRWVISSNFGHYGMTDWYHNTIYLSPSIPASQLASVAKHEYGHILEARAYGGDIQAMITALTPVFGAGGRGNLDGTELAADCVAIVNGASWTHYTGCSNPSWRAAARTLISGHRL